jgi:hypothetical protein
MSETVPQFDRAAVEAAPVLRGGLIDGDKLKLLVVEDILTFRQKGLSGES